MKILVTSLVIGVGGEANKFQLTPICEGLAHKFVGVDVVAINYGDSDKLDITLTPANLILVLEKHLEGKIGNLHMLDRLRGPGSIEVAETIRASTLENISLTHNYLQMVKDGIWLSFDNALN